MPARPNFKTAMPLLVAWLFMCFILAASGQGPDDKLNLSAGKATYHPGETVTIQARLVAADHSGQNISLEIDAPNGSVFLVFTIVTDKEGNASYSFKTSMNESLGSYHLYASYRIGNSSLYAESGFSLASRPPPNGTSRMFLVEPIVYTGAGLAIIAAAAVIGTTEPGKYGIFALFAPLFTRLNKDEALDNKVRYQLMGYLTENPGQHYNALKKVLNLKNGGMVYHLLVLEREGFIKSQRDGIMKRFYPATVKIPETRKRTPDEIEREILQSIEKRPGITQRELVDRLVVSDEVVGYHLRKLVRETKIISWKKGKTRVYFPPGRK